MKNILIILLLLVLFSCKKEDMIDLNCRNCKMEFSLDGQKWNYPIKFLNPISNNGFNISTSNQLGEVVVLSFILHTASLNEKNAEGRVVPFSVNLNYHPFSPVDTGNTIANEGQANISLITSGNQMWLSSNRPEMISGSLKVIKSNEDVFEAEFEANISGPVSDSFPKLDAGLGTKKITQGKLLLYLQ